jgi:hypothetical protein
VTKVPHIFTLPKNIIESHWIWCRKNVGYVSLVQISVNYDENKLRQRKLFVTKETQREKDTRSRLKFPLNISSSIILEMATFILLSFHLFSETEPRHNYTVLTHWNLRFWPKATLWELNTTLTKKYSGTYAYIPKAGKIYSLDWKITYLLSIYTSNV